MSIGIAVVGLLCFFFGYQFYSKFIAEKIYRLDPTFVTPAHRYKDGVDFVPTKKEILWGHHFTSIAGAAPILGPAIAVYWGWLPAFLWVVLGTIFAAGVHDFGTLVISARHKGQSMGTLANRIIGQRAKMLFLFIILILVLMVNAVFAWVIANLFISFPASVLPIFIEIPLAIWIGYRVYRSGGSLLLPSVIALVVMWGTAVVASYVPALQINFVDYLGGAEAANVFMGLNATETTFLIWIVVLFVYCFFASSLPVWTLLQPRDYINSHQLIIGLIVLYLGLLFLAPEVTAPVVNSSANDVSWWPLLFITIACGAISGFHGLVSSGTTSKQLDKETDARYVGYLGSVGEGILALISVIAVATAFSVVDFSSKYASFADASKNGLSSFVNGAANLASGLAIDPTLGKTIVAVVVVSFAATTLDSSVRLMRYIIAEIGSEYKIKVITGNRTATAIAVLASAALALTPGGANGFGSGGYHLWPLFGTSNQLLAGISLLIVTIWLKRLGRNYLPTLLPMLFILFVTIWAMAQQVFTQWMGQEGKMLLFFLGAVILVFAAWIVLEAVRVFATGKDYSKDIPG
ncbi:carbon starvation protein A [Brevibacillus humidisoli]|uniref:carbon starvation CstA family protein n=1 Tax=Brevibacillus humidisoli TaxID=2895522 RepID=UPI001E643B6F|nr:carbon starvation protein A [Brevibacillus humidisoli]UFJ40246.1 carbon starvation protein A [Brevibacillus humidisoli]